MRTDNLGDIGLSEDDGPVCSLESHLIARGFENCSGCRELSLICSIVSSSLSQCSKLVSLFPFWCRSSLISAPWGSNEEVTDSRTAHKYQKYF